MKSKKKPKGYFKRSNRFAFLAKYQRYAIPAVILVIVINLVILGFAIRLMLKNTSGFKQADSYSHISAQLGEPQKIEIVILRRS